MNVKNLKEALKDLPEDLEIAIYSGPFYYDRLTKVNIRGLGTKNAKLVSRVYAEANQKTTLMLILE